MAVGYGRYLHDNPIILSENTALPSDTDLSTLLKSEADFITSNQYLREDCAGNGDDGNITDCFEVRPSTNADMITYTSERWAFETDTTEFTQVNNFSHLKNIITRFHEELLDLFTTKAQPSVAASLNYKSSLPSNLYTTKANWYGGETLISYADYSDGITTSSTTDAEKSDPEKEGDYCGHFSSATFSFCFGTNEEISNVKISHDSTVIYHEFGHAASKIMMNFRNIAGGILQRSEISYAGAREDHASINEGIADWFSYFMNERSHVFEWAFGTFCYPTSDTAEFYCGDRPVSEDDESHLDGISTDIDSRLKYPDYIFYQNYTLKDNPETVSIDIHYAGMTISHFLVALSKDLVATCEIELEEANNTILHILNETYAEIGDLTSMGSDQSASDNTAEASINMLPEEDKDGILLSMQWFQKLTPITFRSFSQIFAKYTYLTLGKSSNTSCNGSYYNIDNVEKLLDSYGLLLFRTYNLNGSNFKNAHEGDNLSVADGNRLKSVLISKDLIKLEDRESKNEAVIFDKGDNMLAIVESKKQIGSIAQISSQIPSDLSYNNANGKISPGEIVGVAINLFNTSNSRMAGIRVLANDWDHAKTDDSKPKPCNTFDDEWPLDTEGAADTSDETEGSYQPNDCGYITRIHGNQELDLNDYPDLDDDEKNDKVHPICFAQLIEEDSTRWAGQDELREQKLVEKSSCLGGEDSTDDCFIRAIKGADYSWHWAIDPQMSWGETIKIGDDTNGNGYDASNMILFEVSPDTPPGTTFNCRFRVSFTNCDECFEDKDNDYDNWADYEFSGDKPFKVINYQFQVVD